MILRRNVEIDDEKSDTDDRDEDSGREQSDFSGERDGKNILFPREKEYLLKIYLFNCLGLLVKQKAYTKLGIY